MSGKFGKCFRLGGRYCIGVRRNKREVGRRRGWGEEGREETGKMGEKRVGIEEMREKRMGSGQGRRDGEWTREKRMGRRQERRWERI